MTEDLKQQIGLPAAVFIIIGYIVGATIFILPGALTAVAGPGVFLAYLLAGIPALFYCFVEADAPGTQALLAWSPARNGSAAG